MAPTTRSSSAPKSASWALDDRLTARARPGAPGNAKWASVPSSGSEAREPGRREGRRGTPRRARAREASALRRAARRCDLATSNECQFDRRPRAGGRCSPSGSLARPSVMAVECRGPGLRGFACGARGSGRALGKHRARARPGHAARTRRARRPPCVRAISPRRRARDRAACPPGEVAVRRGARRLLAA